jgi:ABC-type branched-subunit amino acid transport system substrate-binding protein
MFSCVPGDTVLAGVISRELRARFPRFVLVSAIDHDSRAFAGQLKAEFVRDHLVPLLHVQWPGGAESLSRMARDIARMAPGAIVVIAPARESVALIRAVRGTGFRGGVLAGPWAAQAAASSMEGVIYPVLADIPDPFQAKFRARWGRDPDYTAACAYDAANIVIAAIRKGGLNRVRIRDAVQASSPFPGITGKIEWDERGQNQKTVGLRTCTSGMRDGSRE